MAAVPEEIIKTPSAPITNGPKITFHIPEPKQTGNKQQDGEQSERYTCLKMCFEALIQYPEIRSSTFVHIQKELKRIEATRGLDTGATFSSLSTFSGLEEQFKVQFITGKSDLNSSDLIAMLKADSSSVNDLFCFAVQVPMRCKLPTKLMLKGVMTTLLDSRYDDMGKRLEGFKKNGGYSAGDGLVFKGKHGCYDLNFTPEGILSRVTHISGDAAEVPTKLNLTTSYNLNDNYCDFTAHLSLPPLPIIKLSSFFDPKQKAGPYRVKTLAGKAKLLEDAAGTAYISWKASLQTPEAKTISEAAAVQQEMCTHRKEEGKRKMTAAREAATKALAEKKAKRTIKLSA